MKIALKAEQSLEAIEANIALKRGLKLDGSSATYEELHTEKFVSSHKTSMKAFLNYYLVTIRLFFKDFGPGSRATAQASFLIVFLEICIHILFETDF